MSDTDIVKGLNRSNREALRKVFDRYHHRLFHYLLYRTGDRMEAEDLLQDVYLRLWKYREKITDENLPGYLYAIATSLSNNRARSNRIEIEYYRDLYRSRSGDVAAGGEEGPDEVDEKLLDKLEQCINKLPEKQRTTLLMNRSEGLTYREIAEYLGLSQKAVEKRMQKAYELLKGCMENFLGK